MKRSVMLMCDGHHETRHLSLGAKSKSNFFPFQFFSYSFMHDVEKSFSVTPKMIGSPKHRIINMKNELFALYYRT